MIKLVWGWIIDMIRIETNNRSKILYISIFILITKKKVINIKKNFIIIIYNVFWIFYNLLSLVLSFHKSFFYITQFYY